MFETTLQTQKLYRHQREDIGRLLEVAIQKAPTFETTPQKNYRNLSGAMSPLEKK